MKHTQRRPRRLGVRSLAAFAALLAVLLACEPDTPESLAPTGSELEEALGDGDLAKYGRGRKSKKVLVEPDSVWLASEGQQRFVAKGVGPGNTAVAVTWKATGGEIDSAGLYTAGTAAGKYHVIALRAEDAADTAEVWIAESDSTPADTTDPTDPTDPPSEPTEPPSEPAPPGTPDAAWAGVNTNTGFYTSSSYVADANNHAKALGLGLVRMGIDGVGGSTCGSSFNWSARDATVNSHLAAGLVIHAVTSYGHVSRGSSVTEWRNNFRCFVRAVFNRYRGKIGYYIIGNEPDLKSDQTLYSPANMVEFTRIASEEARAVGGIRIESPPTSSPGKTYLKSMIDLGVTRYADVLGVHNYGSQISDGHAQGIRKPWEWMAASGHPMRPVASSESGTNEAWASYDGGLYQARWFRQNWIQLKRYGYDHVLLYSFRSSAGTSWDIASGSPLSPNRPTYDAVQVSYTTPAFGNGGFEEPNDRELQWAVIYPTGTYQPAEWNRAAFIRSDATRARSGTGYLRFDTGESTSGNVVRRVVEQLTPGRSYTLTAWVKIVGGGTATLKAQGFNHLNGVQEASRSTTTRDSWQQLSVSFTPTRTWVVVTLQGSGTGTSGHAMYWDDVTLSP